MRRLVTLRTFAATAVAGGVVAFVAPAALAAGSATTDPGLKVFQTSGCNACHTLAAAGAKGTVGPNLDKKKPTAALITARVANGKGIMPPFKGKLKAAQIKALAAYIVSVAGKKVTAPVTTTKAPATTTTKAPATTAAAPNTPAPAPAPAGPETLIGDPVAGAAVFASQGCGVCHTLAAAGTAGTVGPNLDNSKPSQNLIKTLVQAGATAGGAVMPQFNLSATDLNNIAAYVYKSTHP